MIVLGSCYSSLERDHKLLVDTLQATDDELRATKVRLDEYQNKVRSDLIALGELSIFIFVTPACAKMTGAAASVKHKRREPDRAISPE